MVMSHIKDAHYEILMSLNNSHALLHFCKVTLLNFRKKIGGFEKVRKKVKF